MNNLIPGHDITAKERTVDVLTNENVNFKDLFLSPVVLSGLQKARFERPSPIQLKAIPYGRCGLDLIVQAKSGTGKTCVFTVIALEAIEVSSSCLQVIILAPTREIAIQIEDVIKAIGQDIKGLKVAAFIGGRPLSEDKISAKNCHIAVGSPGRIFQLIEMEILKCRNVSIFILDEADKLLDNNFQSQINSIYSMLPENKQMIAASATYPDELADFVKRYMRNPTFVRLNPKDMALLGVKQYYYLIGKPPDKFYSVFEHKIKAVVTLLKIHSFQQALIFSNYHSHAKDLSDACNSVGLPATYISGNLEQERRLEAMKMLKDFKCKVLISTDLTSRGIDASNVDVVVNLDVPTDWETYMHRTGRAGRFGSRGVVVSIITSGSEKDDLFKIAKTCSVTINPLACESGKIILGHEPIQDSKTNLESNPVPTVSKSHPKGNVTASYNKDINSTESMPDSNPLFNLNNGNGSTISSHNKTVNSDKSMPKSSKSRHEAGTTSTRNEDVNLVESVDEGNLISGVNNDECGHEAIEMSFSKEFGNCNSKRICEEFNTDDYDNELPCIPSLPELMSKSSKPDSSQFSFAYLELMENLKQYQEHGVLQELRRVEIRKTKKDEKVKNLSHDFETNLRQCYWNSGSDNSADTQRKEVENVIKNSETMEAKNGKAGIVQTSKTEQQNCKPEGRGWWFPSKASETNEAQTSKKEEALAQLSENESISRESSKKINSHEVNREKGNEIVNKNKKERKNRNSSKRKENRNIADKGGENEDTLQCSHSEKILLPRYSANFPTVPSNFSFPDPYLMYARSQYENAWYRYYYWSRYWQYHGSHSYEPCESDHKG